MAAPAPAMLVEWRRTRHAGRYFAAVVAQSGKHGRLFIETEPELGRILLLCLHPFAWRGNAVWLYRRRGLIRRLPDPDDRRGVTIELTVSGRQLVDLAVAANTGEERKLVAVLRPGEVVKLGRLLQKLLAGLEARA